MGILTRDIEEQLPEGLLVRKRRYEGKREWGELQIQMQIQSFESDKKAETGARHGRGVEIECGIYQLGFLI